MLNQVVLMGRLAKEVEIIDKEKNEGILTLAVPRTYKNKDNVYETDFIDCFIAGGVTEGVANYCKKGDTIAVRGSLKTEVIDDKKILQLIVDKVSFLSSKKED